MTTTQTDIRNNNYDSYAKIEFTTDYVNSEFDFSEFSLLIAKTNSTEISCDSCSADFNIVTPFYTIDSSVAFCASHLPTALLDETNITF